MSVELLHVAYARLCWASDLMPLHWNWQDGRCDVRRERRDRQDCPVIGMNIVQREIQCLNRADSLGPSIKIIMTSDIKQACTQNVLLRREAKKTALSAVYTTRVQGPCSHTGVKKWVSKNDTNVHG